MPDSAFLIYLLPLLLIWSSYVLRRKMLQRHARGIRDTAIAEGLTQPASLHPVIDANRCIGCRSCISACPEQHVLGLINDKADLVNPTHCIGHGACRDACPMHAITLVFGTAERGVDIPLVSPQFETSMPGIYIAGELGGMGLIRNAIEQGRQAMASILKRGVQGDSDMLDVVIIGAGPAGISATLSAHEKGLRYATLEQDSLGGTVAHFPRGKVVMTAPVVLPVAGKMNFREVSKENLLEFWEGVISRTGIVIQFNERVESITSTDTGFSVKTSDNEFRTRTILLAIGRRGTPRKLGVPGEEKAKVVYRLIDPEQYRGQHVLVVGGGDSALEAATSIAEQAGTHVTLSYRSGSFSRAKEKNRQKVDAMRSSGRVSVMMSSNVQNIGDDHVEIDQDGKSVSLDNDAVIICAGGILPTPFLQATGIEVETKYGTA